MAQRPVVHTKTIKKKKMDILNDLKGMASTITRLGEEYWQASIAIVVLLIGFIIYKVFF